LDQTNTGGVAGRKGAKTCAMSRRTERREGYTDQSSLVKSARVDQGSFMSIRDNFESLASINVADPRRSCAAHSFRRRDL